MDEMAKTENFEKKEEIVDYLTQNIDMRLSEIRDNISNIYISLGELVSNLDTVTHLKYIKQNLEK